jgi:uncharacterized membrane protein YhaH (DUF805 family)
MRAICARRCNAFLDDFRDARRMFTGTLSRREYARAAVARLGLFAAGVAAIPAALYALNLSQSCPPELCGPIAASLIGIVVMPILYFGLILALTDITVRRLRDIGLAVALAAAIPLLMLGDLMAALTLDGFVFDAYVHGAAHPIPGNLVTALVCVALLCVVRGERVMRGEFAERWGAVGGLALTVVSIASLFAFLKFLNEIAVLFGGITSARITSYVIFYGGAMITPLLLLVLFGLIALRERRLGAA